MPSVVQSWIHGFHDALSFLTCIALPRKNTTAKDLSASTPFFAPVGLVVGLVTTLTAWLGCTFWGYALSGSGLYMLTAWLWLAVNISITRGLHWDGVADLGDAAGSGARGERFRQILKDSRMGAFGAIYLVLAYSGQWIALAGHIGKGHWLLLLLAPAWARAAAVWLAAWTLPSPNTTLGSLFCAGVGQRLGCMYQLLGILILTLLAWFENCTLWQLITTGVLQILLLRYLRVLAIRGGGLSGDFLGACIEWSQLCFLLCTL